MGTTACLHSTSDKMVCYCRLACWIAHYSDPAAAATATKSALASVATAASAAATAAKSALASAAAAGAPRYTTVLAPSKPSTARCACPLSAM